MKILVVRIDHIGDLILTTPLIRSLSRSGHSVDALVRALAMPVLFENPFLFEVFVLEEIVPQFPKNWMLLTKWIRSRAYDAIIIPYAKPKELLFASFLSGLRHRVAMWAGVWGRLTFHQCLRSNIKEDHSHFTDIVLECARAMRITTDGLRPDFFLTDVEKSAAKEEMSERFLGLKIVGIHPGCAGNACNLPSHVYGELAQRLLKFEDIAIVGTGIDSERDLFKEWPLDVVNHPRFYNACGKWNLRELTSRMNTFSVMVVASTGPLHIANALGLKTVSPFCATPGLTSKVWGNLTPGSINISPSDEYCLARRNHSQSHCDFDGQINADKIFSAVIRCIGIPWKKTNE